MGDHGSTVVEAVLVIPVAMLLLLAVVQFALWAHAAQVVQLAASEGDRTARTAGGVAAGETRAQAVLSASGSAVMATSAVASIGPDDEVTVTVKGRAEAVLPWLDLPVSATQIGPVQEFRTSG
jgi:Flp pilus assembly protein TadG